jgi:hypothetical protein
MADLLFQTVKQYCLGYVPTGSVCFSSDDSSNNHYSMAFEDEGEPFGLIIHQEKDGTVSVLLDKKRIVCADTEYVSKIDELFAEIDLFEAVLKACEAKVGSIYPDYKVIKDNDTNVLLGFGNTAMRIVGSDFVQLTYRGERKIIRSKKDLASKVEAFFNKTNEFMFRDVKDRIVNALGEKDVEYHVKRSGLEYIIDVTLENDDVRTIKLVIDANYTRVDAVCGSYAMATDKYTIYDMVARMVFLSTHSKHSLDDGEEEPLHKAQKTE